jgi:hypothetical protein
MAWLTIVVLVAASMSKSMWLTCRVLMICW